MSDLISRCELFNRLAPVQTLGEAYGIIQGMETVDAVPVRHGEWREAAYGFWQCTACCFASEARYKFCPHCGARNIEGDDES